MTDIVNKQTGSIDLVALGEYNGKTELENAKTIFRILAMKADIYDMPVKVRLTYKGGKKFVGLDKKVVE